MLHLGPQVLHLFPQLVHFLLDGLDPVAGCLLTSTETEVKEGAPLSVNAAPVQGVVLAHPWVALGALVVLAGEAVTSCAVVDLVTLVGKFTMAVLVELANIGHSDFLAFNFF